MNRLAFAGIVVLCGALAACPYLVALTSPPGSMILVYLMQLPLFAAGLWYGVAAAALAGVAASLVLLVCSRSPNSRMVVPFSRLSNSPRCTSPGVMASPASVLG